MSTEISRASRFHILSLERSYVGEITHLKPVGHDYFLPGSFIGVYRRKKKLEKSITCVVLGTKVTKQQRSLLVQPISFDHDNESHIVLDPPISLGEGTIVSNFSVKLPYSHSA